ncbi:MULTISPECIES: adenosylcobinamide-phosphate synthase CbiB [unclassified Saccharicrinis]|uniref:adenosylcobinamide-phosphate synthase CbiB n=1 Tax=unclassified Saccharicrinis TaxID=2646859 RepID=UPI003D343667
MIDTLYIPVYILTFGFILDALIGDPYSWPHPIKGFGHLIALGERKLNKGDHTTVKGALLTLLLIGSTWFVLLKIESILAINQWFWLVGGSVFVFYGLANRTLINEGLKVVHALEKEGLEAGRRQLSYIVGRDTSNLNDQQIYTAVLETLSENLSDGVIAPLFYYALGGFPLMFTYKMINTLDSMIGYKSDRYKQFGKVAAKIDDIANFVPARLTALLMVLVSGSYRGGVFVFKYGRRHASPNAGYPESALAGILNCRFGGPNVYHGIRVDKPYMGENPREISKGDVIRACEVNALVSLVMVIGCAVFIWYLKDYNYLFNQMVL